MQGERGSPDHRGSLQILVNLTDRRQGSSASQARKQDAACPAGSRLCPSPAPGRCALWHHRLPGEPRLATVLKTPAKATRHSDLLSLSVPFGALGLPITQTQEEGSGCHFSWKPPQGNGDAGSR